MVRRVIGWSARNPFLVFLMVLGLALGGLWSLRQTPLDAIPDLSDVQVIVFTGWPGRSPDLVEDQVTYPIVTSLLSAPHVKVVRGFSYFGFSFVYVIFEDGTDMYWARSRVLEYMDQAKAQLPEGVTPTLGPDATGVGWALEYALVDHSGTHSLADLRTFQDWYLRYWLKAVPGVADVASVGGFVKQYQVVVDPNALDAYDLSIDRVIAAVRRNNNDVGGRVIEYAGTEFMVRGRGYVKGLDDLRKSVVAARGDGTPILLRDVARIEYGPDLRRGLAEWNGEGEAVGGIVVVRYGADTLSVIQAVKRKLEEVKPSLPEGVDVVLTYDRTSLIDRAVDTLGEKLVEESLIVSLVCIVFLFHLRSALVAILMLPIAILASFVGFKIFGVSSNIMSLSGIAIAVGAMIDAAVVLIENAHKKLERQRPGESRAKVVVEAAQEVGGPLFFSLLIITFSVLPVFSLQAQEGRLFRPLALTWTLSLFFASLLSITLVPVFMVLLVRGRIAPEHRNPLNRVLTWMYQPVFRLAMRWRWLVVGLAVVFLVLTVPVFRSLGSEFMPPLYEGTLLYMPNTLPGVSITEAGRILQVQDKLIRQVPEVESVFGKAGRASTATDPAPLSMIETVINLKPESEWRPGMTVTKLEEELDQRVRLPGVTNSWTMPIKARVDMLTTGIRTPVGVKIYGPSLDRIQEIGERIEEVLGDVPGTRNVYAERVVGGHFLDFDIDREEAARYGLTISDVEGVIESAVGGMNVAMTVEGRERFPVNVRYARELRDDPEGLGRVLLTTARGTQIPLRQVARITRRTGPPVVKSEAGTLVGYVFVDVSGVDLGHYVERAQQVVRDQVKLPAGYFLQWSGQYEYMQRAAERLRIAVPITVLIVFLLLYFNFRRIGETVLVMMTIPFSLVGAFGLLGLLGYNLSVAVWVGVIALAGVSTEIGVVMVMYLNQRLEERTGEGRLEDTGDLAEAVREGAVQRLRPIAMTVTAIIAGLLPIMWSHGTGADVMKRIAAPMVGGMISTTVLGLVVLPAIYMIWRGLQLRHGWGPFRSGPESPADTEEGRA
jgi:Cu(I)/Ag(I) efflux system membrane protein CusA/SilA